MKHRILLFLAVIWLGLAGSVYAQGNNSNIGVRISCTDATSIDIDASRDARRISFTVQAESTTNDVRICFGPTCSATTGLVLRAGATNSYNAVSSAFAYEWVGPISCWGVGAAVVVTFVEIRD